MKFVSPIKFKALMFAVGVALLFNGILIYNIRLSSQKGEQMVKVLVARNNIAIKSVIKASDIEEIMIPQNSKLNGAIENKELIIGKAVSENIYSGEQFIEQKIAKEAQREGFSMDIPKGYRAVTIKVDPVNNVAGFIQKGDFVDILVYFKPTDGEKDEVKYFLQKVEVIDIKGGSKEGDNQVADTAYLTLCLKPEDASKLFIAEETSKIRVILRPYLEEGTVNTDVVDISSLK